MNNETIAILMATYNGAVYLREQIESIVAQTFQHWHLYIHDDGSTDETVAIAKEYANRYPNIISLLEYPSQGGACQNFLSLMERIESSYYMFCDQDDVWLPEKIELSFQEMNRLEHAHPQRAIIVCTDLYVSDAELNIIHSSRWRFSAMYPPYIKTFDDCAPCAGVTGCTMLFNQAAKYCCIYPVSPYAIHDNWLTLCTLKRQGILYGIDKPLMHYRQHGDNCMGAGAKDARKIGFFYRITNIRRIIRRHFVQYKVLQSLGYGSVWKYVKQVMKYRHRIRKQQY
ncbi:glycosyltransferase family 2 protein [Prevotella sp. E9-3]|uniref:glycosyltransferase family 2 protein n=1 Tax=Prevotella sp. E9-3 TaxID=2913621 RepID=UPI00210690E9|nr:glycosyltransferase family 2 protein [Prevotella sp. E9-3]